MPLSALSEVPFESSALQLDGCARSPASDGARNALTVRRRRDSPRVCADPFPERNALTQLQAGPVVTSLSRYPDDGDLHTLIFTLTRDELFCVSSDDQAVVRYEPSNLHDIWLIGPIEPSTAQGCDDVNGDP